MPTTKKQTTNIVQEVAKVEKVAKVAKPRAKKNPAEEAIKAVQAGEFEKAIQETQKIKRIKKVKEEVKAPFSKVLAKIEKEVKVKRPPTAYSLFVKDNYMKTEGTPKDRIRKVAELWKNEKASKVL
jgi:DNA polymerase I-like protein with 3'-5' exonuclease and polymerase domains